MNETDRWNEWIKTQAQKLAQGPVASAEMPTAQLLLTGKQAAAAVNLCSKMLYWAARRGELRVVKIGRAVRYRLADLEAWVASKVQETSRE